MSSKTVIYRLSIFAPPKVDIMQLNAAKEWGEFYPDEPLDGPAELTYERDFVGLEIPRGKVIKMTKRNYVDNFFNNGDLQLGTLESFRAHENKEVNDHTEGTSILYVNNGIEVQQATLTYGFDRFAFCCFEGEVDQVLINKFDNDDYFIIDDILNFAKAISDSLPSLDFKYKRCLYRNVKALVSEAPMKIVMPTLQPDIAEWGGDAQFFIKPNRFSHQKEFRFTWQMPFTVHCPKIINCKEAVKYCSRY